jgi:hypothetical protein
VLVQAVESGQILVSSRMNATTKVNYGSLKLKGAKAELATARSRLSGKTKLLNVNDSRIFPRPVLGRKPGVLFKICRSSPSLVHTMPAHASASASLGYKRKSAKQTRGISLPLEARILERLSTGPRNFDDIRDTTGVSRASLEALARRKLLSCDWGPKGVGNLYKITPRGLDELRRLKSASKVTMGIVKKGLVTMKTMVPQLA